MRVTLKALVTLKIPIYDSWGTDCTIGQIHQQARTSAIAQINSALRCDSYKAKRWSVDDIQVTATVMELGGHAQPDPPTDEDAVPQLMTDEDRLVWFTIKQLLESHRLDEEPLVATLHRTVMNADLASRLSREKDELVETLKGLLAIISGASDLEKPPALTLRVVVEELTNAVAKYETQWTGGT